MVNEPIRVLVLAANDVLAVDRWCAPDAGQRANPPHAYVVERVADVASAAMAIESALPGSPFDLLVTVDIAGRAVCALLALDPVLPALAFGAVGADRGPSDRVTVVAGVPAPALQSELVELAARKGRAERELVRLQRCLDDDAVRSAALAVEEAARLQEKEAFNFALFQYSPTATTVVDRAGRVVKSNLARRQSVWPLPDLGSELYRVGTDAYSVDMRLALEDSIERGRVQTFAEVRHGDRYESITIAPFPQGAIVITMDITERKQAEVQARQQQEQLIQAQKMAALGTLVSGVAHEVSNPNNIMILSAAQLRKTVGYVTRVLDRLKEERGDFDVGPRPYSAVREELAELADVIGRAAERVKTLVNDLKDFARQDDADRREIVDVNKTVQSAVSLLGAVIRKATNRFAESYEPGLPPVEGQARRIEQVVMNLVANACQALPDKEKALRVCTRREAGGEGVVIEVSDEGVGIPAENLARITDPFFTTKHDSGGTGLGLSISRKIVERCNGTLSFESKVNQGTTASVRLPCVRQEARAR